VRGLHLARELGTYRPRLAVGLIKNDAGKHSGLGHPGSVAARPAVVDVEIDVISARNRAMDTQDRQILALLVEDGRRTYDDIARRVALSAPAVKRRVDRLLARGALQGFTAVVDHNALGDHTEALIELFYAPGTLLDAVTDTLRRHPEVVEAWSVTGEADAIARVRTQNNADLERLIMDLQRDGHVVRTRSQVVMSRLVSRAGN
jgi:Lrp/AsnC family leucine-responsive transcriptional regulator